MTALSLDPRNPFESLTDADGASLDDLDPVNSGLSSADDTPLSSPTFSTPGYYWQLASGGGGAGSESGAAGGSQTVATSGSGLVFVNTYASGDSASYEACIVAAEKQLEGLFTNSMTINLTFKEASSGKDGTLAGNTWSSVKVSYARLKAALLKVAPSDVLPASDPIPGGSGDDWSIPESYARLLGLSSSAPSVDSTITLNTSYSWTYGQDAINAITHEISEGSMGRVGGDGDQNGAYATMDLFRYTSAGALDLTDGRDGETTYFSSDGGAVTSATATPELSFNNEYSGSTKENSGDTADWTQNAVFGTGHIGETITLDQTELDVMGALGWTVDLQQQFFTASSGRWDTPTDWSGGYNPITVQDAAIGVLDAAAATLDADVTVNSIATNSSSSLQIGDDATLIATHGSALNSADSYTLYSGNLGQITVDAGSTLEIGDTFDNTGALDVGDGASGVGYLDLAGAVTLNGGGAVTMGESGGATGDIQSAPSSSGALANVDDTIAGAGTIDVASFDNQARGKVEANGPPATDDSLDEPLRIIAGTFTNEGFMYAEARSELGFGQDGGTGSLVTTGDIDLESQATLAISGNFTISGSGGIGLKGAGAFIGSDGLAAATLTNEATIGSYSPYGHIGDHGLYGDDANDLTFVNTGTVFVTGAGDDLYLDTGALVISDPGGTLEAENGGELLVNSTVDTGVIRILGHPATAGTVEATSGGIVVVDATIQDGVQSPFSSAAGQVLIAGGTVQVVAGAGAIDVPVNFNGGGGALELFGAASAVGAITGLVVDDAFEVTGTSVTSVAIGTSGIDVTTNSGTYDFSNVTFDDTVTGYVAWSDSVTGLERITFTADAPISLNETGWTIYEGNAAIDLAGGDDTVHFQGPSGDQATLSATSGEWDTIIGSNGTVTLDDAQASVLGGDDTVDPTGTAGNQVSLYQTNGVWDTVNGSSAVVYLTDAQASIFGGSDSADLIGSTGNQVSLYNTGANWDGVTGSKSTIYLSDARASVTGGDDTIDMLAAPGSTNQVSLYGTAGEWDAIVGSSALVYLTDAQASITGGTDTIDFEGSAGNQASLYGTAGDWDVVNGGGGIVYLTNARSSVTGGGDTIDFEGTSGDQASLYGTSGTWDSVDGAGGIVYLTDARSSVTGGGDTIDFEGTSGNQASLYGTSGTWDSVDGAGGLIYLTDAQSSITGGSDTIDFEGSTGNAVSLYDTGGSYDAVNGASGLVYLTDAQANVTGGLDTIDFEGSTGDAASLYGTAGVWDTVNGSGGTIYLTSAQTSAIGGGNTIDFAGGSGDIASLGSTGSTGDTVEGDGGVVDLYGVTASITGSGDTLNFNDADTVSLTTSPDMLVFGQGIGGEDVIKGVTSSDTFQFSKNDFANFTALAARATSSGGNTTITLNAADAVTLIGVTSLSASQFTFV